MGKFLCFADIVMMDLYTMHNHYYQAHSSKMKETVQGRVSVFATHLDSLLCTFRKVEITLMQKTVLYAAAV